MKSTLAVFGTFAIALSFTSFSATAGTCSGRLPELTDLSQSIACGDVGPKQMLELQTMLREKLIARGYSLSSAGEAFSLSGTLSTHREIHAFPDPSNATLLPVEFDGKVWTGTGEVRNTNDEVMSQGTITDYEWPNTFYDENAETEFAQSRCLRAVKRAISKIQKCN